MKPAEKQIAEVWGWSTSEDCDHYDGAYETRDEAVDAGHANADGEPFYVIRGEYCDAASAVPKAGRILEWMNEYAGDNWPGDLTDDWPSVTEEAKTELESFLAQWARKHTQPRFWIGISSERIDPDNEEPTKQ